MEEVLAAYKSMEGLLICFLVLQAGIILVRFIVSRGRSKKAKEADAALEARITAAVAAEINAAESRITQAVIAEIKASETRLLLRIRTDMPKPAKSINALNENAGNMVADLLESGNYAVGPKLF